MNRTGGQVENATELLTPIVSPLRQGFAVQADSERMLLLENSISLYSKTFINEPQGRCYLKNRGLDADTLSFGVVGFSDGLSGKEWCKDKQLKEKMTEVGLLLKNGKERFENCLVFPIRDEDGKLVTMYGRFTGEGKKRHVYLPCCPKWLWDVQVVDSGEIIVVESILDALSIKKAGFEHVLSLNGTNPGSDVLAWMKKRDFSSVLAVFDGDKAGIEATGRLKKAFSEDLPCEALAKQGKGRFSTLKLPEKMDPNEYLQAHGAEKLKKLIDGMTKEWRPLTRVCAADVSSSPSVGMQDGSFSMNDRKYEIQGLERTARKLRATVRVKAGRLFHVDTIDL